MKKDFKEKYFELKRRHKAEVNLISYLSYTTMLATLRDECGFGKERMRKATNRFKFKIKCIKDKYVTPDEMYEDLCNQLGKEFVEKLMQNQEFDKNGNFTDCRVRD